REQAAMLDLECLPPVHHRDADCARLAACFWIGWEGAVLRAKLERDPVALDLFAGYFLSGLRH
ncbi:MAG TPA: TetR family transcriptional regulator C-terminal domain-containing protein, partial [Thauera sp.]|nr:TetR family transcriptional regulator C-terminal domain-containing protein [Thauera sp.]